MAPPHPPAAMDPVTHAALGIATAVAPTTTRLRDRLLVGDLRYATLPLTIAPLWNIRLLPHQPAEHVRWAPQRSMRTAPWTELRQLLNGQAFTRDQPPHPPAAKIPA